MLLQEEKKNPDIYQPTNEETSNMKFIATRFTEMERQRKKVDSNWDLFQRMINADFEPYGDERSSSVVPLASSLIELFISETRKLETQYNFKGEGNFKAQAKALEYAWKTDYRRNKRKEEFNDNDYICAGFGTSVIYTGVEQCFETRKDPVFSSDGSINEWKEKSKKDTKIFTVNFDIRKFYIDDRATKIANANDCIAIQYITKEELLKISENNPAYKNIDKVSEVGMSSETTFSVKEDNPEGKYVKLTHYWNLKKDYYGVCANDKIMIREHPIMSTMNGKKAIPFVVRALGKKNYSIYGRGFCEAAMVFNSEINNLREMLMDAIRRSNQQTLLLGNGLSFDGRQFSYDNEILTFNGQLAGNFEQVTGQGPNQAIFNYIDRLYRDIAVYVGIDIQNMIGQPQQTAFQTEVQREAMQKRVNVWLENRDIAYERFADLYKDLLQTYFVYTLGYDGEGEFPEIEIEGGKFENGKFRKIKGTSIFKVDPEFLRGDIYVDVFTNTTAPTINAVDRAQKLELIKSIAEFTNGYMLAKQAGEDIESILPFKKTLENLASDFNISVEQNTENSDLQNQKAEFLNKLKAMQQGNMGQELPPNQQEVGLM